MKEAAPDFWTIKCMTPGAFRPHNGNEHHSDQHQNGHQHRDSHLGQGMEGDETANKHKQTSK